jgi:hypothetical protein
MSQLRAIATPVNRAEQELWQRVQAFFADKSQAGGERSAIQRLVYLFDRWRDEGEFEDIQLYGKVISGFLPEGFELTRMTRSPFGFNFTVDKKHHFHFRINTQRYTVKQVA